MRRLASCSVLFLAACSVLFLASCSVLFLASCSGPKPAEVVKKAEPAKSSHGSN